MDEGAVHISYHPPPTSFLLVQHSNCYRPIPQPEPSDHRFHKHLTGFSCLNPARMTSNNTNPELMCATYIIIIITSATHTHATHARSPHARTHTRCCYSRHIPDPITCCWLLCTHALTHRNTPAWPSLPPPASSLFRGWEGPLLINLLTHTISFPGSARPCQTFFFFSNLSIPLSASSSSAHHSPPPSYSVSLFLSSPLCFLPSPHSFFSFPPSC